MLEARWSKDQQDGEEPPNVTKSSYPTIFFFDLDQNRTVWEIFGAEKFISIDKFRRVYLLTNEIWTEENESSQKEDGEAEDDAKNEDQQEERVSRHEKYDNYIWRINYGTSIDPDSYESMGNQSSAIAVQTVNSYKLNFGKNKDLEITESVKLVDAYFHNKGERISLLYKGLGSFTFEMKKAKSVFHQTEWFAKIDDMEFSAKLQFKYKINKKYGQQSTVCRATGKGKDENEKMIDIKIEMHDYTSKPW